MDENNIQGIQFKDSENVVNTNTLIERRFNVDKKKEIQVRTKQFWFNKKVNPRIVIWPHYNYFLNTLYIGPFFVRLFSPIFIICSLFFAFFCK
jgi:hypothetical protein